MRAMKFRAWDGKEFLPLTREVACIDDEGCLRSRIEGIVFSQFTGLLDKNGREIYEGDVLGYPGKVRAVVYWDSGAFKTFDGEFRFFMEDSDLSLAEVIGNIYEHPELVR